MNKPTYEELAAQVEVLINATETLRKSKSRVEKQVAWMVINGAVRNKPSTHLAEIRAEAAYKALLDVQEEIIQRGLYHSAPDFIEQYAMRIRQEVK